MPATAARRAIPHDAPARPVRVNPPPAARLTLVAAPPLQRSRVAPARDIPDPDPAFVRALAVQAFEAIDGTRTIGQLGPVITVALARALAQQRALRSDQRIVLRDFRRSIPRAISCRVDRVSTIAAEAAVVLRLGGRARAVALRFEWAHRHWRASELVVL